jgi:multiple antibiotic resistance protein
VVNLADTAATAFVMLLVTIGPLDIVPLFVSLTARVRPQRRRALAIQAALVAGGVLAAFALGGEALLGLLGIGGPAFRIAGGILLLLLSIDLVFARHTGLSSITPPEEIEAERERAIAVFPLAIPLIAGPGAMAAVVLLMGRAGGDPARQAVVLAMLALVMALALAAMLAAERLMRLLGVTGVNVAARVSGILLAALAVQFVLDGLQASGLFPVTR